MVGGVSPDKKTALTSKKSIMKKIAIAGGGISGLTVAYALINANQDLEVTVFEADNRAGGKIWSDRTDGYLCEKGANGFLDNKPRTLELCKSLGIDPVRSNENSKKRFIFSGGRLKELPESPLSFIKSDLLSWSGKLRLLLELNAPKGPRMKLSPILLYGVSEEKLLKNLLTPWFQEYMRETRIG